MNTTITMQTPGAIHGRAAVSSNSAPTRRDDSRPAGCRQPGEGAAGARSPAGRESVDLRNCANRYCVVEHHSGSLLAGRCAAGVASRFHGGGEVRAQVGDGDCAVCCGLDAYRQIRGGLFVPKRHHVQSPEAAPGKSCDAREHWAIDLASTTFGVRIG